MQQDSHKNALTRIGGIVLLLLVVVVVIFGWRWYHPAVDGQSHQGLGCQQDPLQRNVEVSDGLTVLPPITLQPFVVSGFCHASDAEWGTGEIKVAKGYKLTEATLCLNSRCSDLNQIQQDPHEADVFRMETPMVSATKGTVYTASLYGKATAPGLSPVTFNASTIVQFTGCTSSPCS
jgi:hypothetical protein